MIYELFKISKSNFNVWKSRSLNHIQENDFVELFCSLVYVTCYFKVKLLTKSLAKLVFKQRNFESTLIFLVCLKLNLR